VRQGAQLHDQVTRLEASAVGWRRLDHLLATVSRIQVQNVRIIESWSGMEAEPYNSYLTEVMTRNGAS
jgi:hypothetical protein